MLKELFRNRKVMQSDSLEKGVLGTQLQFKNLDLNFTII